MHLNLIRTYDESHHCRVRRILRCRHRHIAVCSLRSGRGAVSCVAAVGEEVGGIVIVGAVRQADFRGLVPLVLDSRCEFGGFCCSFDRGL